MLQMSESGRSCPGADVRSATLGVDADRQGLVALHEAGIDPPGLANHLDIVEALEDLLPDDLELQLGEPHADAAVDSKAERQMRARPGPVDDEVIGMIDR